MLVFFQQEILDIFRQTDGFIATFAVQFNNWLVTEQSL